MNDNLILGNLFSLYQTIAGSYAGSVIHSFKEFQIISTPGSIWPNIAYDVSNKNLSDDLIAEMSFKMEEQHQHPFVISIHSNESFSRFRRNGFMPIDRWTGMYFNVEEVSKTAIGLESNSVNEISTEELGEWSHIVSQTLFAGKNLESRLFASLPADKTSLVAIYRDQMMAGTAMIYFDEKNTAGIYMVCVTEKFRGMKLGQSLMRYCLDHIRNKEVGYCVLQSTVAGIPLYRSLGFKESSTYNLYWKIR